jgi:hypothetical protein
MIIFRCNRLNFVTFPFVPADSLLLDMSNKHVEISILPILTNLR